MGKLLLWTRSKLTSKTGKQSLTKMLMRREKQRETNARELMARRAGVEQMQAPKRETLMKTRETLGEALRFQTTMCILRNRQDSLPLDLPWTISLSWLDNSIKTKMITRSQRASCSSSSTRSSSQWTKMTKRRRRMRMTLSKTRRYSA